MVKNPLLAFLLLLSFGIFSCADRHDRESQAMQNMVEKYPMPSIMHFQYGYESVIRAVSGTLPVSEDGNLFEGINKLSHFNDTSASGHWYSSTSGIKDAFHQDLVDEGFELLMSLEQADQDIVAYIKGDDVVHGAIVIFETNEIVHVFDLAGDIRMDRLSKIIQDGNMDALNILNLDLIDL